MGFRWPILHQSLVQYSYDGLENNLNDSHDNKAWFWHQEGAIICQVQEIDLWGGQNHVLCYFVRKMGFRWPILHKSWVQTSHYDLENNLNDFYTNKAWFWNQKVTKIHQNKVNL